MGNLFKKLKSYDPPILIDLLRIATGGFIVYKGIVFATNFQSFTGDIETVGWILIAAHMGQGIIFVHIVGGSLLLLGGATRLMSLLNIPILAGAVLFNYKKMLTVDNYMELSTTIILLVILLVILMAGSGRLSIEKMRKREDEKTTA